MNRKIVALLLALLLVASSVAAFAVAPKNQFVITENGLVEIDSVTGNVVNTINLDEVHKESVSEMKPTWTILAHWDKNTFLVYNTENDKYEIKKVTAEHGTQLDNMGTDSSAIPTTGTDSFKHYYTNYTNSKLINSVTFAPKAFGDGVNFQHTAKSLFTIDVQYASKAYITIKDDEGRLYPVAGASWKAAKNAYEVDLAKGVNTISWFGHDGAEYHGNGSLANPFIMELNVNMTVETVEKKLDGVTPEENDTVALRFNYTVRHGATHHVATDAAASAPKTGDAGMAYMSLVALIVMMGAAVVVTRKVRNF